MHLSHPYPHSHARSILATVNNDPPQTSPQTKACKSLKRCSSLSSISSTDTINADTKSPDEKTRIRRCKIALSSITGSYVKRSSVANSTLSTLPSVKWSHIKDSLLTNILTLKKANVESSTVSNVLYIRRATITASTISDVIRIKKATTTGSLLRRVALLERSTIKDCVVCDCIIYKTDFEGMVLENGIWRDGCLVGRVDQSKEVVVRAVEEGDFPRVDEQAGDYDEIIEKRGVRGVKDSLAKEGKNEDEEALPVYSHAVC